MALRRKNKRWKKPFTCLPTQRNKTSLDMEIMIAEGHSSTNATRRAVAVGGHPYLFEVCDPPRARAIINELFGTQN